MKKLLLILFAISTFFSCQRKYDVTVKGKVINRGSKLPIGNAVVHFADGVGASSSFDLSGAGPTVYDSVYADKDGNYAFTAHSRLKGLFIWATKAGYSISKIEGTLPGHETNAIDGEGLHENVVLSIEAGAFLYFFF